MAKLPYPESSRAQDFSVRGVARFMDHSGGRKRGYPEGETKNEVRNQMPEDKQGAKYLNDASGWVRGAKGEPTCYDEDATNYPGGGFDHRDPKTGLPKRW
jgi:hypothetical protein